MRDEFETVQSLISAIDLYLGGLNAPHVESVRTGIARNRAGPHQPRKVRGLELQDEMSATLGTMACTELATAITAALPFLDWIRYDLYPIADIGVPFAEGHAFASVIGEDAPVRAHDFDLGIFLIKPHTLYRDHHHKAPELYVPLTGPHGWRFKPGDAFSWLAANVPVWNDPWASHATLTGDTPFLALFCWTRDVAEPARVVQSPDWADIEGNLPSKPKVFP